MFEIFIYVIFVIIIYFMMQKYNCQEKFEDMPPIPSGNWGKSCKTSGKKFSFKKNIDSTYTLTTECKTNSYQSSRSAINLKEDDYISNNLNFINKSLKLVPK